MYEERGSQIEARPADWVGQYMEASVRFPGGAGHVQLVLRSTSAVPLALASRIKR